MSKYVNLDDPEVTYSHSYGKTDVYIVGAEAERIDLVKCGECIYREAGAPTWSYCPRIDRVVTQSFFCGHGMRREE